MPFLDKYRWYELYNVVNRSDEKKPAIFLDRDGVIIKEKHYISNPDDVELFPGVAEKIMQLKSFNLPIVVVTNQSGIGQGKLDWNDYNLVHTKILLLLGLENPFTAVYANSYHPSKIDAAWRKPNRGMFEQAAEDLNICLEKSIMVGDKWIDIKAGISAGIKHLVHVKTGHGKNERAKVIESFPQAILADSLEQTDFSCLI